MANKKNDGELSYLQMPLPTGTSYYRQSKVSWSGLNKRQEVDTGMLSAEKNISTKEAPYLVPSEKPNIYQTYSSPISMFGFDDFLIVIYEDENKIKVDYITADNNTYTSVLQDQIKEGLGADVQRCVVQFNKSDYGNDYLYDGNYSKKLLIFPDKKSMDFYISSNDFVISSLDDPNIVRIDSILNASDESKIYFAEDTKATYKYDGSEWVISTVPFFPDIKYATVHQSRLFGVDDYRVYASGFNDYSNWTLDTVEEYNESNAWYSAAQSNIKAGGVFTGITTYENHVICFKKDFMHEIYNTKNPFRITDIFAEGAIDNRTIQNVDGKLIFVSEDNVKIYTGSNPRIISYNLNLGKITYAVSGTDGRSYYLYCEDKDGGKMFTYDTYCEQWSEQEAQGRVLSFAHNTNGMFMLRTDGAYRTDSGEYDDWSFETDLITRQSSSNTSYQTVNIKHLKKLQMHADIESGANMQIYLLYDGESFNKNTSHKVYDSNDKEGRVAIRVKPRMTAHYGLKLHVEGSGYVRIYELELLLENGGDMYV